ncbi:MAG: hypothetical protein AUJ82_03720 [Verrucomicrobia bacterium CG1_02_43_26]|nr:MAG: hypothetical protein AUJ82_03720 [Verrucomicrobia bacterium CG1_02_43_26]
MPRLETERLILRPMCLYDAKSIRRLANDPIVSDTLEMPHPYEEGVAEDWIMGQPDGWRERGELFLLITNKENRVSMGSTSLFIDVKNRKAEFGYWLGTEYWGYGYATEAAEAIIEFGFLTLGLNRMEGYHLARNPKSGRVLQKLGFQKEGCLRKSFSKNGLFEDMVVNGLLKSEYLALKSKEV